MASVTVTESGKITLNDAKYIINAWKNEDPDFVPDELTPELFIELWNRFVNVKGAEK